VQSKNKDKSLASELASSSAKNIPDDETFTAFQVWLDFIYIFIISD